MTSCQVCAGTGETDRPGFNPDGTWGVMPCVCCRGTGTVPSYTDLRQAIIAIAGKCKDYHSSDIFAVCANALGLTFGELKAEIKR